MDKIKIIDEFLNNDDLEKCKQIIKDGKWEYGHNSNGNNKMSNPFFYMDLNHIDFFNTIIY